jgi:aminoglycoside 6'-N-acetyltransferase I
MASKPAASTVTIRIIHKGDDRFLARVSPGVFDGALDENALAEYLRDPRHHLAAALDGETVVGFASGVHYFHPDKPVPEMFVNEVGVAPTHRGRGTGKRVLDALLAHARTVGCRNAWVLTDRGNPAAMRLYATLGGREAPRDQVMFEFGIE